MPNRSPLTATEARQLDTRWRAARSLSVGQIDLLDNPLLDKRIEHRACIVQRGTDLPEVTVWTWSR